MIYLFYPFFFYNAKLKERNCYSFTVSTDIAENRKNAERYVNKKLIFYKL